MLFKIDENFPEEVAELLHGSEHDARTVRQQDLAGAGDAVVGAVCRDEDRALVTQDLGFADIRAHPPSDYRGLVVLRLMRQDKKHVLKVVRDLLPLLAEEPLRQRLWIVDEGGVRIHE